LPASRLPQLALPDSADDKFNDLGGLQTAIENRSASWCVAHQFSPILQRPIARHQRTAKLMPPHDDLKLLRPHSAMTSHFAL